MSSSRYISIRKGFIAATPIMMGYFPVAMAFGLLANNTGINFVEATLFSVLVFAGASQFMALDLIASGVLYGNIILSTLLLNLRHMMMSASLSLRIKEHRKSRLLFIAFGITDETFAVASLSEEEINAPFLFSLNGCSYLAWVTGTIAGYFVGTILPKAVQSSLGIGLYAMFVAILIPEIKKSFRVLVLFVASAGLYYFIVLFKLIPSGWDLILTILISSTFGAIIFKEE